MTQAMGLWMGMPPIFWVGVAGVVGAMVGSFGGLVSHRLPRMLGLVQRDAITTQGLQEPYGLSRPVSHCDACRTPLQWWTNVPLVGFLLLRGRCAFCGVRIPRVYWAMEWLCAIWWAWVVWRFGLTWPALWWSLWGTVLLILAVVDAQTQYLPDVLTLPLLWAGLLGSSFQVLALGLDESVWASALGYGLFWGLAMLYKFLRGRDGIGLGDAKLLAALGAWLGLSALSAVVLVAVTLQLLAFAGRAKAVRHLPMALGPFLAVAAVAWLVVLRDFPVWAWMGVMG